MLENNGFLSSAEMEKQLRSEVMGVRLALTDWAHDASITSVGAKRRECIGTAFAVQGESWFADLVMLALSQSLLLQGVCIKVQCIDVL